MLQIILQLLMALGVYTGPKSTNDILVIDQATGQTYGIGVSNGGGASVTTRNPTIYYLVKDDEGNFRLVKR